MKEWKIWVGIALTIIMCSGGIIYGAGKLDERVSNNKAEIVDIKEMYQQTLEHWQTINTRLSTIEGMLK